MLKKLKQVRLGLGIEDDTTNPEAVAGGEEGGGAPTEPVAAAPVEDDGVAAVAEAGEAVIDDSEVIEELDDAQAALEEIYEDMRVSLQNGGMNTDTARMAKRYADRTLARVNMANPMPSCEAFGGFGDRYVSTSVSMEGVGSAIKDIWEKIKTWFNNMWKNIRVYWQKVWDASPKLKARAEALRKKADDLGGKTASEKTIEVGADIVKKLHNDQGKLPAVAELSGVMEKVTKLTQLLFGDYYAQALKFAEHYGDKLASVNEPTAANLEALGLGAGDLVSPASVVKTKAGTLFTPNDKATGKFAGASEVDTSASLFGGQVLAIATFATGVGAEADPTNPDTPATGGKEPAAGGKEPVATGGSSATAERFNSFGKNTVRLMTLLEKSPEVSEATTNTLALGEVQKLCDEVIKLCDSIASYRKDWDMAEKTQSKILRAGDNFSRAAGKSTEKGGDDVSAATAAVKLTKTAGEWIAQPNQNFSRYAMEAAKAVLMVCDKSLAQYS